MSKVTTFLMFPSRTKEAVEFYQRVFGDDFELGHAGGPDGEGYMAAFEIDGQEFQVYEGGPHFEFTEAISLFISCKDQAEVDYFWEKLSGGGGEESQCGWVKDKFGVSWQVVPESLMKMISDPDQTKAGRAVQAMLKMKKLVIKDLEAAFEGKE